MKKSTYLAPTLILLSTLPGCGGDSKPSLCYRTTAENVCPEIWSDASCAPTGKAELGYFLRAVAFASTCTPPVKRSEIGTFGTFGGDGKMGGYDVVDISLSDNATRWTAFYTQPKIDGSNYGGGLVSISVIPGNDPNCGVAWYGAYVPGFKLMNARQACPEVKP
jgi:hypothetical protein